MTAIKAAVSQYKIYRKQSINKADWLSLQHLLHLFVYFVVAHMVFINYDIDMMNSFIVAFINS